SASPASSPGVNNTQNMNTSDRTVQGIVNETRKVIDSYMNDYANFGFRPFPEGWKSWQFWPSTGFWPQRLHDLWHILGWIAMALLLSVGAPFWEDTLESLFGIKNMLRGGSETKNVEQASGAGQPRP